VISLQVAWTLSDAVGGSIAKLVMRSGRVEVHADHPDQSLQRTSLPGRGDSAVRPLVSTLSLAYEHVAELLGERGVEVDPSCIWRWVQAYARS